MIMGFKGSIVSAMPVTHGCDRLRLPYLLPFYKIKGLLPSFESRKQALPVYTE
jgi:hypothetical protein